MQHALTRIGAAFAGALLLNACGGSGGQAPFSVEDASVASVRSALLDRRTTCRQVVQQALARIEALDRQGPALRAVLETNPDALAIADALDARQARGEPLGPLHCAPLLVKDNYNTGDRMATTAGSLIMGDFRAPSDALTVAKLRAAGAVPIGKTNMDEFAQGATGYGSRGGQALNAHKRNRIPGGSSGGSGVGIAAGYAVLATGSDTGGSIRIPSAFNGVVGIKPTMGLVGRSGVIPSSLTLDVAGPITRNVADAAAMLGVMAGLDPGDAATQAGVGKVAADYTVFLDAAGLSGARLGALASWVGVALTGENAEFDAALSEALGLMSTRGAQVSPSLTVPPFATAGQVLAAVEILASARANDEIGGYLRAVGHPTLRSLDDVYARGQAIGPTLVKRLSALKGLSEARYDEGTWTAALALRQRVTDALLKTMDDARVDALVFLTMTCPASPLPGVVDNAYACKEAGAMPFAFGQGYGGDAILMASFTGLPEITVPAGFTRDGVPIAISFLGRPFSEGTLIKLAYAYEQASRKRRAPEFGR